ncbi:MAG: hypothetical protein IPF93_16695 [Saprospiraceae bacterium]|nr:hypothetical protein [Saprospiraceae bacterium]
MHTITTTQKTSKKVAYSRCRYSFLNEEVEVLIVISKKPDPKPFDFKDLVGKLEWSGNALKEQKRLRKEWGD